MCRIESHQLLPEIFKLNPALKPKFSNATSHFSKELVLIDSILYKPSLW
jgi:hypothetical protein